MQQRRRKITITVQCDCQTHKEHQVTIDLSPCRDNNPNQEDQNQRQQDPEEAKKPTSTSALSPPIMVDLVMADDVLCEKVVSKEQESYPWPELASLPSPVLPLLLPSVEWDAEALELEL